MKFLLLLLLLTGLQTSMFAQENQNEVIKSSVTGIIDKTPADVMEELKTKDKNDVFNFLKELVKGAAGFTKSSGNLRNFSQDIYTSDEDNLFKSIGNNENAAIIFMYRNVSVDDDTDPAGAAGNKTGLKIDFESLNTLYFHKDRLTEKWSNYLLATKKVYLFILDLEDKFYADNAKQDMDKKLTNSIIKINYKTSFFKQSFKDLIQVGKQLGSMGGAKTTISSKYHFTLTMIEIDPKRIKAPCDIAVKNTSFKEDFLIPVHEKNVATFQVGLVNKKFRINNFSIESQKLVVKPDSAQKAEWKSNLYALVELHLPRDIDNFKPLWKAVFEKGAKDIPKNKRFVNWLYGITLERIGVYGGLKISKDPLSDLHAGLSYAITKELNLNLGWTWSNEVQPQVKEIGNIGSLDDAKQYATRSYSKGKFSWGLSFSPSSVISMLGLKDKKED